MGQTCKVCRAWEAYADVGQFPRSDRATPRGSERFYSCEMFMIESRSEKKEDGLRSRLTEARRGAEPEREKARAQGRRPEPARARGRRPERARRRGRVASGKVSAPSVARSRPAFRTRPSYRPRVRASREEASCVEGHGCGTGRSLTCKNNHTGVRTCYVVPEPGDTRVGAVYPCGVPFTRTTPSRLP